MKPLTIIINNLNDGQYLPGLLDSILAQDRNDFDLIGIDAGSTDNSLDMYKKYNVPVVDCTGMNQAASVNRVVRDIESVYFSWINPDDRYLPNFVSTHLEAFETDYDVVHSRLFVNSGGHRRTHTPRGIVASIKDGQNYIMHPTTMIRWSTWAAVGCFDESFVYAFDFEFWIRTHRFGGKFHRIEEETAAFCPRPTSLTGTRTDEIRKEIRRVQDTHGLPTHRRYQP